MNDVDSWQAGVDGDRDASLRQTSKKVQRHLISVGNTSASKARHVHWSRSDTVYDPVKSDDFLADLDRHSHFVYRSPLRLKCDDSVRL